VGWYLCGYVFFSLIALRESRHALVTLLPFAVFPILLIHRVVPARWSTLPALAFAGVCFASTVARPIPSVTGYREAVDYLASRAPANSIILFAGNRDGAMAFNARVAEPIKSLSILRVDKLLTKVTVRRELGLVEFPYREPEISAMLGQLGVSYVVLEPNFWSDLAVMKALHNVLLSPEYRLVNTIPVAGGNRGEEKLEIYQSVSPVAPGQRSFALQLGIGNLQLKGCIGVPILECAK
jgi:hypothetical protein